jgi:hypothetical protein
LCVYSLAYPARKAHAPDCVVICGLSGCTIFFHYPTEVTIFGDTTLDIKCVFDFCYNCCLKHLSLLEEFHGGSMDDDEEGRKSSSNFRKENI